METILQAIEAGAMVTFLILFVRGDIMSANVADRIIKETRLQNSNLVKSMLTGVEEAVYRGHLKADATIKNGHK